MNCIIGQSGGPTSVINSSLAGAISAAIDFKFDKIYGMKNGIEGLLKGEFIEIDKDKFVAGDYAKKLAARPASILGSCRYKLPEINENETYEKIFESLKKLEITSFIYIGGNDSMDTVQKLNSYMKENNISGVNVIGVPKTIDNDLCVMDHSPGFATAAKYVISSIRAIRADVDIYDIKSVTFVEIMGRDAGRLAASSLVSNYGADKKQVNLLYMKEDKKSKEDIIAEIKEALKDEPNVIVAVSEGFMDTEGFFKGEREQVNDKGFHHPVLAGLAGRISSFVEKELNIKTKVIELSILQRSNVLISKVDSTEAFDLGYEAVALSTEKTNLIPILKREKEGAYRTSFAYVSPDKIANKEKFIPKDRLQSRDTLQEKMISYLLPLIQGEVQQNFSNGMPVFASLDDFSRPLQL